MEDSLYIGYVESEMKNRQALKVARRIKDEIWIINEFYEDEAREIYKKLTGKQV